jgi:hypothetical protein
MALWFDLRPMRPDDWANQDAARWRSNMWIRQAYEEGAQEAIDAIEAERDLAKMADE